MAVEARIDDLIEAGWSVLDSDFDPISFHRWRRSALNCLNDTLGPDHYYARHFATLWRHGCNAETLAAVGILSEAEQQMATNRRGGGLLDLRPFPGSDTDLLECLTELKGQILSTDR